VDVIIHLSSLVTSLTAGLGETEWLYKATFSFDANNLNSDQFTNLIFEGLVGYTPQHLCGQFL
jgi:hypothetical protein